MTSTRIWPSLPVLLALLCTSPAARAEAQLIDRIEASVNSQLVLHSDIEKFMKTRKLRLQIDPLFKGSEVANKGDAATSAEIVDFLLDEKLIQQRFPVPDSEVEQRINSIQAENRIDRNQLKAAINAEGFNFDDYFEMMRAGWSKRTLIGQEIQTRVSITEDDVRNAYQNRPGAAAAGSTPSTLKGNRTVHLQMITVSYSNYKTRDGAKEVANRAYTALKSGEAWEEVSKRFSDHPSAQTGGDLGTIPEDQVNSTMRKRVQELEPGQISAVYSSDQAGAYYIVRLVSATSGAVAADSGYERAKEQIREELLNKEYQHQIALWLERQRQTAFVHVTGSGK